jgi:hypothetical protein
MANVIDRKANRKALFNKVKSQFTSKNVVLTYDQWENTYFKTEADCVSAKPAAPDANGYVKQLNLFDKLNQPNVKGIIIKDDFLDENSDEYKSLSDKITFVKRYACFDFDWTTTSTTKYCSGAEQSKTNTDNTDNTNSTNTLNLSDYTGTFDSKTDGIFTIILSGENGVQKLRLTAENLPSSINDVFLDQTNDKYTFEIKLPNIIPAAVIALIKDKKLIVKYSTDFNTIDYDMGGIKKGTAIRVKSVKKSEDTKKNKKDDNNKDSENGNIVINKKVFNYPDVDDRDVAPISGYKQNDVFPYRPGEMNDDIGDLNQMFFGDRRGNQFGTKLLKRLQSFAIDPNDKDPKITQDMFNDLVSNFKKNIIKESVKKVLKDYINRKK